MQSVFTAVFIIYYNCDRLINDIINLARPLRGFCLGLFVFLKSPYNGVLFFYPNSNPPAKPLFLPSKLYIIYVRRYNLKQDISEKTYKKEREAHIDE